MDGERKTTGDFLLDGIAYPLDQNGKKQKVATGKITPKDLIMNALTMLAITAVTILCNLLITPDVHYTQIFGWNFRLLLVINWILGIVMTYFARRSGIDTAKLTPDHIKSEDEKQKAFERVKDVQEAQEKLDDLIEKDFDHRRKNLEKAIDKLVKPLLKEKEWHIGDPLPEGTHKKVVKMKKRLESMTPPIISLAGLAQSEVSYDITSLYDIRPAPEKTGTLWWVRKGAGKVGWFGIFPVILSIIANGLAVGITIGNVVYTVGVVAAMLFNAAREYAWAFASVSRYGVDRNRQIIKILNTVTGYEKPLDENTK